MGLQTKEMVIGDVLKWELPNEIVREKRSISRDLAATVGLVLGEIMEPDTAVAQIATYASAGALVADGGTFRLGYKGQWTTALAWNLIFADVKTAFELLSTVDDTITFAAGVAETWCIIGSTATWTTAGQKDEIEIDGRLLLDGTVPMTDALFTVTTIGSTAACAVILATAANADYVLLEKVTLEDLKTKNNITRAMVYKGPCILDGNNLFGVAAELAGAKTQLIALGMTIRTEPSIYQVGPPTS